MLFNRAYRQDNYIAIIEISEINRCEFMPVTL